MKAWFCLITFIVINYALFSGVIITREEMGIESKELYHQNIYAEIQNDRIVAIFDFNKNEITHIDHNLRIYTTIDFEKFRIETQKQNQAQIDSELRTMEPERRQMMAAATNNLFRQMRPGFVLVDTLNVCGYKAFEYHVYNDNIICQKLWISKELQEKINIEVNPVNIQQLERTLKDNRDAYFAAMGIDLDPISQVVESIETVGYIVKRIDYGLRDKPDPEFEREMDTIPSAITEVLVMGIDQDILSHHLRFRKLEYMDYIGAVMRAYGE